MGAPGGAAEPGPVGPEPATGRGAEEIQREDGRGWLRALGLFLFLLAVSVVSPVVLVALPFAFLVLGLPIRRTGLVAAGLLALFFAAGVGPAGGMWYLERGWAILVGGWFLGLSLRWPETRFLPRALGAVAGSFGVSALLFRVQPGSWETVDWLVSNRMRTQLGEMFAIARQVGDGGSISPEMSDALYRAVEVQGVVFPALLGLASVAALGVAWWCWVRLGRDHGGGLMPVRGFRFNDQLVWVFVLGLMLVLLGSSGPWDRLGTNTVVFMGALYALRGAAVLLFLNGGISVVGSLFLAAALLFLAPVLLGGAMVVGLGDTWLDLRKRARAMTEPDG